MGNSNKTKQQILDELAEMRRRYLELEKKAAESKKEEKELSRKEAHQELILNSLPMAFYTAHPYGVYGGTWVSDQIHRVCGFTPEQFMADIDLWASRLHPDDREYVLEEFEKLGIKEEIKTEYRWKAADGSYIWFLDQAVLLRDETGEPKEIVGTWRDITKQKREENALRERYEFETLLSHLSAEFVNLSASEVGREIKHGFKHLIEFLGADRGSLLFFSDNDRRLERTESSAVKGIKPFPFQDISSLLPWYTEKMRRGEIVTLADLNRFPDEAGTERHQAQKEGIKAIVGIPLRAEGKVLGAMAFSSIQKARTWPDDLVKQLQLIGEIIANAVVRKQADEALRENERRLKIIFEYAPDAYYLSDVKGNFIDGNKAAEKLIGYTKKELIGSNFLKLKLLPRSQIPKAAALLAQNILGKPTGPDEFTLLRKNGDQVETEIRTYPVKISNHPYVLGIARDITQRKRVEEALRESEKKFRSIVESSPMGMHMYMLDKEGRLIFTDANPAAETILGLDCKQFIGKSIEEAFPPLKDTEVPEKYRLAASTGKSWVTEQIDYDYNRIKGAFQVYAFQTAPGKMAALFLDITERKRAEEALKESEERFSLFMDNLPAIAFIKDEKSRTLYVNKYMKDVLGAKDWIGKTPKEIFPLNIASQMIEDDKKAYNEGYKIIQETVTDKNGVDKIYQTYKFLIKRQRKPSLLGGIALNITKQKDAEEKIKQSLKEKDVMLREIHHRVKNNMQIISSLLRLQSRDIKDKSALEKFQNSRNRIKSMALIHEGLYSSEDLSQINFSEYIDKITIHLFSHFSKLAGRANLKLDLGDVFLDINRAIPCGQIVNELVSNSLKHAFPEGRMGEIIVKMNVDKNGKHTIIAKDTGIGFPKGLDFRKADTLGLQMVNDLVGQLKGTIAHDRMAGTVFTIMF